LLGKILRDDQRSRPEISLLVRHMRLLVCSLQVKVAQLTRTETIQNATELNVAGSINRQSNAVRGDVTAALRFQGTKSQRLQRAQVVEVAEKW
jgi:hypothetical protein